MNHHDIRIFSVFHKEFSLPQCNGITPIQVGRRHAHIALPMIHDDLGEHSISDKNDRFCELTALYWIWQNLDTISEPYIGLAHYRRYFFLPDQTPIYEIYHCNHFANEWITQPALWQCMREQLTMGKLIVPIPTDFSQHSSTVKMQYLSAHGEADWQLFERTLLHLHPEYQTALDALANMSRMCCYNMFVGSKAFVRHYCAWLFPILFAIDAQLAPREDAYQNRALGFMAERLLNVYILHHQLPTASLPVLLFA